MIWRCTSCGRDFTAVSIPINCVYCRSEAIAMTAVFKKVEKRLLSKSLNVEVEARCLVEEESLDKCPSER